MVPYEYYMPSATIALIPWILSTNHKRYNDWVSITIANWMQSKTFFFFLFIQFAGSHPMITHAMGIAVVSLIEVTATWMSGSRAKTRMAALTVTLLLRSEHSGCLISGCLTKAWNEHKKVASEACLLWPLGLVREDPWDIYFLEGTLISTCKFQTKSPPQAQFCLIQIFRLSFWELIVKWVPVLSRLSNLTAAYAPMDPSSFSSLALQF